MRACSLSTSARDTTATFGLDGLSLIGMGGFEGNIWAGAEGPFGLFIDERADERQHEALQMIFGGQAGGWPADFAEGVGEMHGIKVR